MTAFDVVVERDRRVPMRDGVHLATDVHRPARAGQALPGPFPVILERTPYGKGAASRSERTAADPRPADRAAIAAYFVAHGFIVVYQDCRGRHGSEGRFRKYLDDAEDGYDCCAWLVRQPWCNGRIGTMGLSYAAHTQAALGCLDPPGLAAQILDSGGFSNAFQGGIRQGGAFELKQATWAFNHALESPEIQADPVLRAALEAVDLKDWFTRLPWRPGHSPLQWAPDYEAYLFEQWWHGAFDDYWRQLGLYAQGWHERYARVPTVHMSSWYHPYPRTATENYLGLSGRAPTWLILGPWTHGDRSVTFAGDADFGPAATFDGQVAPDWRQFRLRFFQRFLKDEPTGAEADPAVRLFVMGGGSGRRNADGRLDQGGRWHSAAHWPLPDTRWTDFHLHGDGRLSTEAPAAGAAPLRYRHDPAHPVPSVGGAITSGQPVMVGGGFNQVEGPAVYGCSPPYLPLSSRPDVLVFETEPLAEDVVVAGPITVTLWVASDCPDTDFTAKLIDVHPPSADYPQGYALNLTDGILRARYRDSWEHPAPLEPGRPVRIVIEPLPTANRFVAGHRIRLDIASSNFPHFDVNPNSDEPEGQGRLARVATNTLFVDAARPSIIRLPVVSL